MFRVEKTDLMSALATVKEEKKSEEEKHKQKLKNILKECDDLKAKLNSSENKLIMLKNENTNNLLVNSSTVESKYSEMIENIQSNSNFFENQLSISQKTIFECNQEILRLNDEIENFKMKEKNRIETENMKGNNNDNDNESENKSEIDRIDYPEMPYMDMKMIVKSKPKLQSQLVAQFNMILDQKLAGAQSEIQALQDRLQWYVRSHSHVI